MGLSWSSIQILRSKQSTSEETFFKYFCRAKRQCESSVRLVRQIRHLLLRIPALQRKPLVKFMSSFCGQCGAQQNAGQKFCMQCGASAAPPPAPVCPTCHQAWPLDLPFPETSRLFAQLLPPPVGEPVTSVMPTQATAVEMDHLIRAQQLPFVPLLAETFVIGRDCLNCGRPNAGVSCETCGFVR